MENLGPLSVRYDDALPALSPARARVLEFLQSQPAGVSCERVAAEFGQHVNTVRGHLDELVLAGLALRDARGGSRRGRPAWHYRANPRRPEPDARVREHAALAGALAAHLIRTSPDPSEEARTAGREWGRQVARDRDVARRPSTDHTDPARQEALGILDDLGFAPDDPPEGEVVRLPRCPLLDVARRYPEVICRMHRGLVEGALVELGGDASRVDLLPFADPHACLLILPRAGKAPS